ncbi:MAG: hypothetical protein ACKVP7_08050 [Hyphomicrobiaceae bacterium]
MSIIDEAAVLEVPVSETDTVFEVLIEPAQRTSDRQFYAVWFGDEFLLTHHDPEHAACRALLARGITGQLSVRWRGSNHAASSFDIERGARFAISESRQRGPVVKLYREFQMRGNEDPGDP